MLGVALLARGFAVMKPGFAAWSRTRGWALAWGKWLWMKYILSLELQVSKACAGWVSAGNLASLLQLARLVKLMKLWHCLIRPVQIFKIVSLFDLTRKHRSNLTDTSSDIIYTFMFVCLFVAKLMFVCCKGSVGQR